MNTIEAEKMDATIEKIAGLFPAHERRAVRTFLLRAGYGQSWDWIGPRVGLSPREAVWVAKKGEHAMNRAIDAGKIERRRLAEWLQIEIEPAHDTEN